MRKENFEKNLAEREQLLETLESKPFLLRFGFSNNCNLRCAYCREEWSKSEYMPFEIIKKMAPVFPYVKKTWLFGNGEPLMHPQFQEIGEYISGFGVELCFLTNGQLIDDGIARRWAETGIGRVRISIDAATKETYEKLRRGGSFDRLIKAISSVNSWKEKLGVEKPALGFNFVAMLDNIRELPALVRLARDLGICEIGVSHLRNFHAYELTKQSLFFNRELSDAMMGEARAAAAEFGIQFVGPPLYSDPDPGPASAAPKKCTEPWSTAFILFEGSVLGCGCSGFGLTPAGNLYKDSFMDIWNGPGFRALRRTVNSGNPPLLCKNCIDDAQKHSVHNFRSLMTVDFYERHTKELKDI